MVPAVLVCFCPAVASTREGSRDKIHSSLVSSALASCCHKPPPITSSSLVQGQELDEGQDGAEPVTRSRLGDFNHTVLLVMALFCIVMVLLALAGDVHPNPGPGLSDTPTLQLLNCFKYYDSGRHHKIFIIDSVASRWRRLGLALNISGYHLDNIEQSSHRNVEDWCLTMLSHWLRGTAGDGPVTWERLLEAMEDARCGELAQQVRTALQQCETDSPSHGPTHSPHLPDPASLADDPTHSTPHPLTTYQQYLKDLYSAEYPGYSKPQFTRHRPKQIVNLVLVHKEDHEGDKLQRECLLYQLHGNIDLIQQKKTPLTKDQITVLASGATASTVLIEGAPGIGKTTLLWQLCHQWADGNLLKSWDLVILVQLRDETTRTAQCLSDLLYHPDDDISKAVCRIVERREGENVLLIFDGYDELSDDQRTDSIFIRLLRRQCRSLRKATVVVSSRPFATKTLPHQFKNSLDQHVEIVGFNEQDIETYLTSACENNPDLLRDLKSYISTQAFISSVLYNPLHCTIVTELYLQYWQRGEKGFAPSTLTQLYEAIVLNLLRRHLCLDMTPSWRDIPSDVSHQLKQLGELAARGIEQREYIFDNVPSDTLGLMHSVKPLHDYRPNHPISHSFIHLTLQEFLAGRYWSQLPLQQLTELLQRHDLFPIQEYLKGMHHSRRREESLRVTHWPVLLFLAGLTTIPTELITPWTDQDDTNSESSTSDDDPVEPHPSLCQLLFESQSPHLVSTVFSGRRVQIDDDAMSSPLDWFTTGYCITHSDTTSSWSVEFDDSSQCLQAFSSGLHYSSTTTHRSEGTGSLTELTLSTSVSDESDSPYLEIFPSLFPYSKAITELELYGGDLCSDDRGVPVLQKLSHYCPRLRKLYHPKLHPPYFSQIPQLPQHTLDTLTLKLPLVKDDSVLGHHLQQCLALKHLELWGPDDDDITPFLTSISPLLDGQIEHLRLYGVSITSGACVEVLVHSLTSPHSSLYKLELLYCTISSSDYHHLTTAIATSNLTHFTTDCSLHIDVTAAKGLATALTHSKTLEEVEVVERPISNDVVRVLAEAMNHSRVKMLVIRWVSKDTVLDYSYPTDRMYIYN